MCCNCMLVTYEPATMAGKPTKQQSLIFSFFDIPENMEGNSHVRKLPHRQHFPAADVSAV